MPSPSASASSKTSVTADADAAFAAFADTERDAPTAMIVRSPSSMNARAMVCDRARRHGLPVVAATAGASERPGDTMRTTCRIAAGKTRALFAVTDAEHLSRESTNRYLRGQWPDGTPMPDKLHAVLLRGDGRGDQPEFQLDP